MAELPSQAWLSITKESHHFVVYYFEKTESSSPKYKLYFPFISKPEDEVLKKVRTFAERIADACHCTIEDML